MVLNPAIIALISGSFLISGFALYASVTGLTIIRWWDISSGSELQLALERKTYLVSTIVAYLLVFELLSLFLFIYTADYMHGLFVGAMCAAGSLNVNAYGYPTLTLKTINSILSGIWLILNYTDNQGFDYPLIKTKYKFLLYIVGSLALETILLTNYFLGMSPDVITSCCGTLFSEDTLSIAGEIASLSPYITKTLFYCSLWFTLITGIHFYLTEKDARLFSYLSVWLLFFSLISIVSFISIYFYELPTHHCPFCLLQKEYDYIGYTIYLCLFIAGIAGGGVGVIDRYKGLQSLKDIIPRLQKRLTLVSMVGYAIFAAISTYPMIFSDFRLVR